MSFVRSSGPGGQNVNKLATAAQLRFDLAGSVALAAEVKARLRALSGRRLTEEGALLIIARNHRTQEHNRREAEEPAGRTHPARARAAQSRARPTRPTRAARERRLEQKAQRRKTKRLRSRPGWDA